MCGCAWWETHYWLNEDLLMGVALYGDKPALLVAPTYYEPARFVPGTAMSVLPAEKILLQTRQGIYVLHISFIVLLAGDYFVCQKYQRC